MIGNNQQISIWACPVCQAPLKLLAQQAKETSSENGWCCENNHHFDISKEGYTNLLLAHQKSSSNPGDTRAMITSRRAFLSAGHYRPLAEKLTHVLSQHLDDKASVLDSGCGEGYYLQQLYQQRSDLHLFGIDISRDAVKLASRQFSEGSFAVASSFNLPVLTSSVDALFRVFAPGDPMEVTRVLKPSGIFVVVSPGPRHLLALKELIYTKAQEHDLPNQQDGFHLLDEQRISYQLEIGDKESIKQLLGMTPFYWKGDRAAKAKLDDLGVLSTEVEFVLRVYSPIKL